MKRMTGKQFLAIRTKLGLSQAKFGALLGYKGPQMVSSFERDNHKREIPVQLALLMEAIDGGFWSKHWPSIAEMAAAEEAKAQEAASKKAAREAERIAKAEAKAQADEAEAA
jgi:transcriptional regulator with XRE-family HTH domain